MDRNEARQWLLRYDWSPAERAQIAAALRQLEDDAELSATLEQYDRLRETLADVSAEVEPADGWDAFEDRLQDAIADRTPRVWWRPSAVAAAVLLLLAGAWQLGWFVPPTATHAPSSASRDLQQLAFAPEDVAGAVSLFDEMAGFLGQRPQWVLVSDDVSDVGVGDQPAPSAAPLLLLRLALSRDGRIVSTSDVAIIPGQTAAMTVPLAGGGQVHYRLAATAGSPARLQFATEVYGAGGSAQSLGTLQTDLALTPDVVMPAGELMTTGGRYSVKIVFAQASPAKERR